MKLKFYSIPLILVLLCMAFAVVVRFSYTNEGDRIYDYKYVSSEDMQEIISANDLVEQSDIIVKAKYNGERKVTSDAFYSDVEVLSVYKGDAAMKGKTICTMEILYIFPQDEFINSTSAFLTPMQPGEEYIMLLKHMQFEPKRKLADYQKSLYYPVTKGAFGCYRISDKKQTQLIDPNKMNTINSLKGVDVFTSDRKALDTYNQYKTNIFNQFGVK